ncbi:class I SAM-dependent methyltransferase [Polynucleobacter asymbioticus]|uniref:class I SAM-dependent methyltransferase n=1 Tax=Polynucleobacter asymbioticus TaxID=576611 RepID=UPI0012DB1E7F|nr:class I SAM-dependent methyltransferase [Polynucleobacter asymbioticus]
MNSTSIDTYAICEECGSANYISEQGAEEDNKHYFNNHKLSENIPIRSLMFSVFNRIDRLFNYQEFSTYEKLLKQIETRVDEAPTSVEIGFGGGDELNGRLARGANCFGIDLSSTVVEAYKRNFPHYANRVVCEPAGKSSISCNLIYSNALFEHLDHPDLFLQATHEQLQKDGILAMRIPVKINENAGANEIDINYWKPCHRGLYTLKGIDSILKRNGFKITQQATLSYYGYKVMNCLLKAGHTSMHDIRCPYAKTPNLTIAGYLKALVLALFEKPICVEYAAIAIKV